MPRSRWTKPRIARVCFLAGRGKDAREIADDVLIQSTPSAVSRCALQHGIVLQERFEGNLVLTMPDLLLDGLEAQARRRNQKPDALASAALCVLAGDPVLMTNVLDDGV